MESNLAGATDRYGSELSIIFNLQLVTNRFKMMSQKLT